LFTGASFALAQPDDKVVVDTAPSGKAKAATSSPNLVFQKDGPSCIDESGSCCDSPCCPSCPPPGRIWASADYLLWWIKDSRFPPLVTASPAGSAGILGRPGTVVLFGGSDTDNELRMGGRFTAGFWLNECHTIGLEGSFFFLGSRSVDFTAAGSNTLTPTVVARPFFNVVTGAEDSELVPGLIKTSSSSRLQGAEGNVLANILCCSSCCGCGGLRVDLIGGFRYLELDEGLGIGENLTPAPGLPVIGGTVINLFDEFDTHNRFYGGQLGVRAEASRGPMFVNLTSKIALGETEATIDINGRTQITPPGGTTFVGTGGLFALPTNIGHFHRNEFAVVPEVGVNVGYQFSDHLRAYVGYTFLYWSDVFRPGDQIDRSINPTQLPNAGGSVLTGPARPLPLLRDTDFWAQGINLGLEFRY
jgi:hypothetical protein